MLLTYQGLDILSSQLGRFNTNARTDKRSAIIQFSVQHGTTRSNKLLCYVRRGLHYNHNSEEVPSSRAVDKAHDNCDEPKLFCQHPLPHQERPA